MRVDPPADLEIMLVQPLEARRLEAVVGADIFEELGERALETDLALDRLHLGADPRDLGKAEIVDVIGGHRQRGVF